MRRVRQESAEVYEVSPTEVAIALGLYLCEGDEVTLEHLYGDKFRLVVRTHEDEDFDIPVPCPDPIGDAYAAAYVAESIPLIMIPPPLVPEAPDMHPDAVAYRQYTGTGEFEATA